MSDEERDFAGWPIESIERIADNCEGVLRRAGRPPRLLPYDRARVLLELEHLRDTIPEREADR